MKIIVASDAFKGSLSSSEVAQAAARGIHAVYPQCEIIALPVADGGEGTIDALVDVLQGERITTTVSDPLGRPITAHYGIAGTKAIIEMAAASGLTLLRQEERNPWLTSTYGTGEMIMNALRKGCRRFLIGIGGSATNDAGIGMLQALGFRFYDDQGKEITDCRGGRLQDIAHIDDCHVPALVRQAHFTIACDVDTPFCGKEGAAPIFAPQKGADPDMVVRLDAGMASFAQVLFQQYAIDITSLPGAGAAGGMGGTLHAVLGASLQRGIDTVLDAINFDQTIRGADLIITGEGKIDHQTAKGKTAAGILARAKRQGIPVVAIGGRVEPCEELNQMGFAGIYPIAEDTTPLHIAMQTDIAKTNITQTVAQLLKIAQQ